MDTGLSNLLIWMHQLRGILEGPVKRQLIIGYFFADSLAHFGFFAGRRTGYRVFEMYWRR